MRPQLKHFLYWSPRVLGILFALFLNVFALDVLVKGRNLCLVLMAFMIHSIPTLAVVVILILAWRWEWVGGLFILLAAGYGFEARGNLPAILAISGPLLVAGALFLTGWFSNVRFANRSKREAK
jgi:hypothetical protein